MPACSQNGRWHGMMMLSVRCCCGAPILSQSSVLVRAKSFRFPFSVPVLFAEQFQLNEHDSQRY